MKILDFNTIKNLGLTADEMYRWTEEVWLKQDEFILPTKMKMWLGDYGRYMTMPACLPEYDIAGVKFICRNIHDSEGLPKRNANIIIQKISETGLEAVMDATFITTMRTGANAAHNAITFQKNNVKTIGLLGLGLCAKTFLYFYRSQVKNNVEIRLLRYKDQAEKFSELFGNYPGISFVICDKLEDVLASDLIVSAVSYADDVIAPDYEYPTGVTIIPIHTGGFQNCDLTFDKVVVDDIGHVKGYKYFDDFSKRMVRITDVVNCRAKGRETDDERIVVYDGGLAIQDLYFAMKILEKSKNIGITVDMDNHREKYWVDEFII